MDLRVEGLALLAEGDELEAGDRVGELVGERLQRTLVEVTVLSRQVQVVEDRQQLGQHRRLGGVDDALAVTLGAPAVVGVLRAHALQVLGALRELGLHVGDLTVAVGVGIDVGECLLDLGLEPGVDLRLGGVVAGDRLLVDDGVRVVVLGAGSLLGGGLSTVGRGRLRVGVLRIARVVGHLVGVRHYFFSSPVSVSVAVGSSSTTSASTTLSSVASASPACAWVAPALASAS